MMETITFLMFVTLHFVVVTSQSVVGGDQTEARLLVVLEESQQALQRRLTESLQARSSNLLIDVEIVMMDHRVITERYNQTCDVLAKTSFSLILDLTWAGWPQLRAVAEGNGLPYLRLETAKHLFVQAMDDFLVERSTLDAVLVFENENEIDETLYWIIGNSYIRILVMSLEDGDTFTRIKNLRPAPSFYVVYGDSKTLESVIEKAIQMKLMKRDSRWNLVLTDFNSSLPTKQLDAMVTFLEMKPTSCCIVLNKQSDCECSQFTSPIPPFISEAALIVARSLALLKASGKPLLQPVNCQTLTATSRQATDDFQNVLMSEVAESSYNYNSLTKLLTFPVEFEFLSRNRDKRTEIATWSMEDGLQKQAGYNSTDLNRFFRIGTVARTPWTYNKTDGDGAVVTDEFDQPILEGYCLEMIERMASEKLMNFEYEVTLPSDGTNDFGRKNIDSGEWSGLIGDLIAGDIDMIVAPMTMTSEREEVIDFVAPYFDQSGISIVVRKKEVKRSLFKFLTVLERDVWLAILGALLVTAVMIWLLDK